MPHMLLPLTGHHYRLNRETHTWGKVSVGQRLKSMTGRVADWFIPDSNIKTHINHWRYPHPTWTSGQQHQNNLHVGQHTIESHCQDDMTKQTGARCPLAQTRWSVCTHHHSNRLLYLGL